ncbi:hypothetical protein [Deinococcus peraridilitoris]|uniref:Uncharacterized protein n=1 Tax=Deinococcus peraridilitoris (strain DSM 19664 / LMG 22246 / CIP 109416 / KR-200) TaxID=937777 RepID=L0A808_DEIPD|nr:hypothetical protein [Deinococcus peraridilitoris]AFZ69180.1 hypothetical protein Deipe_3755 [Deinococcus peraridilitoris DSM 19664]
MNLLYALHTHYGWYLQLLPVLVLIWTAIRRRERLQRLAPVLLDINVTLGLLTYLLTGVQVSLWHPVLMFAAVALAHAVARQRDRRVVIGVWLVVLVLIVGGVRSASLS